MSNPFGLVKPLVFKEFLMIPAMRNDATYYRMCSFGSPATMTVAKMPLFYTVFYTYTFLKQYSSIMSVS